MVASPKMSFIAVTFDVDLHSLGLSISAYQYEKRVNDGLVSTFLLVAGVAGGALLSIDILVY